MVSFPKPGLLGNLGQLRGEETQWAEKVEKGLDTSVCSRGEKTDPLWLLPVVCTEKAGEHASIRKHPQNFSSILTPAHIPNPSVHAPLGDLSPSA